MAGKLAGDACGQAVVPDAICTIDMLQVFKSEPYSESADIFSLAIVMYEMFSRRSMVSRVCCCEGGTHKEVRSVASFSVAWAAMLHFTPSTVGNNSK